jgi:hypothetical protein
MRSRLLIPVLIAAAAVTVRAADHRDRLARVIPATSATVLDLACTIGTVTLTGVNRSDVGIQIERRVPSAEDLPRLPITIDTEANRIRVRAEQPDGGTDPGLSSDIRVELPPAVPVDVRVFEGRLRIENLTRQTTATIRRGPLTASRLTGAIRPETGMGDLSLRESQLIAGGVIRLRAFNGDVALALRPRPVNARILALSLNGRITSDIPLAMRTSFGPRFGETTLGAGEPLISIDVVTGDIDLRAGG